MNVGLIGYSQCGRSTLYRASAKGQAKGDVTSVPVPDPRFDLMVEQVKPKKATPATVIFHDSLDAIQPTGKAFGTRFLEQARNLDLLLHVVRAFDDPIAPYHATIDPARDAENVLVEIVLTDLQIVEGRLERLRKSQESRKPGTPEYNETQFLERVQDPLSEGVPLRNLELNEEEARILRGFQFLSAKPLLVALNVGEAEVAALSSDHAALVENLGSRGILAFPVCAPLEEEIAALDPADQPEFLEGLGLSEPASDRVIQSIYDSLGLITFFTAGENETRAWPLRRGSNALKAAATIHTEIAKGFIRCEVVHYADYVAAGSLDAAYKAGKMSLEGKEYVMQDGDMIHIRNKS